METIGTILGRTFKLRPRTSPPPVLSISAPVQEGVNVNAVAKDWVLVKEFSLSYHSGDLCKLIGFPDYGSLN